MHMDIHKAELIFGKKKLNSKYNPYEYWTKRGITYKDNFQYNQIFIEGEKALLNYLQSISFNTVLEFGCGFGRVTKLILENFSVQNYDAFDLSPVQIKNAKQFCKNFDVNLQVSTIQDFKST